MGNFLRTECSGNQRVLHARLEDAEFYWREDLKRGMDGLADELDRIVFVEGLGSIGQKWRRVLEIARTIDAMRPAGERASEADLARAARLCKADLASTMIRDGKEFTALQGVIGAHYATACSESDAVATAIREHYQPRTATDPLPGGAIGRALGLADRMDTIVGCFLAGIKPTGSQDPFALRRGANGAVRLVSETRGVRLDALPEAASGHYSGVLGDAALRTKWIERQCRLLIRPQKSCRRPIAARENQQQRRKNTDGDTHHPEPYRGSRLARALSHGSAPSSCPTSVERWGRRRSR